MLVWLLWPMCFGLVQAFNEGLAVINSVGSAVSYSTPYGLCVSVVGLMMLCLVAILNVACATRLGRLCLSCTLLLAVTHRVI